MDDIMEEVDRVTIEELTKLSRNRTGDGNYDNFADQSVIAMSSMIKTAHSVKAMTSNCKEIVDTYSTLIKAWKALIDATVLLSEEGAL